MADWRSLLAKAAEGQRLSLEEGIKIYKEADLLALGRVATLLRERKHPHNLITFVIDRNINYTNVCTCQCRFCAFFREENHPEAYVISREELFAKIEELIQAGGTQVLIQGGLHPRLGLDFYIDMLKDIKRRYKIHIHSFSPPEIIHMSRLSGLTITEVLKRLKKAGLDSLPGGGAEILVNRVRKIISPHKISWEEWMEVMLTAHQVGLRSTATMMFGSIENPEERILHLVRIREAQDQTGGFTAFIPWSYQPGNTQLGGTTATGMDYLRMLAISRIMLDNIPNIQASWVTQGAKLAQVALWFGANDFGGTMLEENVVRAAGVRNWVPLEEILHCIRAAGKVPAQRNTLYEIIRIYD
nr:cyclic dehypoxanthinyl futalosine synthase [Calderihabitans maritimus]